MVTDEGNNFPSIKMMPLLAHAVSGMLDASQEQLVNLSKAKDKPYILDDETVDRVIRLLTEQNKNIPQQKALCTHWLEQKLTTEQNKTINEMMKNITELEIVNKQVLFLANHCKDYTIDKMLNMEDGELGLADLTGKIYSPTISSETTSSKSYQRKSFSLPPKVTCQKNKIENNGESYIFRHAEWGELGRIDIIPQGKQSQINTYVSAGDPRDPMTELRTTLFCTIAIEFNQALENKYGGGIKVKLPCDNLKPSKKLIESKAMVCLKCDTPVALLIFAHDANTLDQLEDYARMMYSQTVEMNLPTWIIGKEEEFIPGIEGIALILKTWPERKKAEKIRSSVFEPMLYKLQTQHCK